MTSKRGSLVTKVKNMPRNSIQELKKNLRIISQRTGVKIPSWEIRLQKVITDLDKLLNHLSLEIVTKLLLGTDPDKDMREHLLKIAGFGCPPAKILREALASGINTIKALKEKKEPFDVLLKNLLEAVSRLLKRRLPINELLGDEFTKTVLEPLKELTKDTQWADMQPKLVDQQRKSSLRQSFIKTKKSQKCLKSTADFKNTMKAIANGNLSTEELLDLEKKVIDDLRLHFSILHTSIPSEEFEEYIKDPYEMTKAPNVKADSTFINQFVFGLVAIVLENGTTVTAMQRQLEWLGNLLEKAVADNNYPAVMSIRGALVYIPLSKFWDSGTYNEIPDSFIETSDKFNETMQTATLLVHRQKSYGAMRETIHDAYKKYIDGSIKHPPIGFLGLVLTDLTFRNDTNKTMLEDGTVNGFKITQLAKSIEGFEEEVAESNKLLKGIGNNPEYKTGLITATLEQKTPTEDELLNLSSKIRSKIHTDNMIFLDDLKTMSYDTWKKKYLPEGSQMTEKEFKQIAKKRFFLVLRNLSPDELTKKYNSNGLSILEISEQDIHNDRWSHKFTRAFVSDPKEIQFIDTWVDIPFWKSKLLEEGTTMTLTEMLDSFGLFFKKLFITRDDVKEKLQTEMSEIKTFEQFITTYSNKVFEYNILDPNDSKLLTLVKDFITKNPNNDQGECWKIIKQHSLDLKLNKK